MLLQPFHGECSDEIFAGYPWFFREDALKSNTFPWSIALDERQNLLNLDISNKVNLKEYIDFRYNESLDKVQILDCDSEETAEKRKISYLTLNWFMQTLLDRSDRMSMYNGLELRVPFCDYRLVEYMWNVPWEMKALNGREKGLLRYVVRDLLPDEIINRKKATYYGIGLGLAKIVRTVMNDTNEILTVSAYLNNQYGQEDLYIGVPAIINSNGARELLELELSEENQAKLDASAKILKENMNNIRKALNA